MGLSRQAALRVLGLEEGFDDVDLKRARRRALALRHPDHGGSASDVLEIELACEVLTKQRETALRTGDRPFVRRGVDRPSFTMDVLPVEAFEALILAAAEMGDVSDDDPPYRLEVCMHEPDETWVYFEIVPDAGGSTVSLSVESKSPVSIEAVRDRWIETINRL